MDYYCRGTLWMILIFYMLPHLTCNNMSCPSNCLCRSEGAVKCVGHTITDIPKQLPEHTYTLQLNDTRMTFINEQSLADKDLLVRFSLTHSHLLAVHPRAFHVAPQLKSVKLSSNDLPTLPALVFRPLTSLGQLHLDENQLETLAVDLFAGLVELMDLDLSWNKLRNLSSDVFHGLNKLYILNLGRNSIEKLPPTIFHSLSQLNQLLLYNNELQVLEAGMFDELVNLEKLMLHHNKITSLSPKVFWPLKSLKILTLSSNLLQVIPEKSFYNMPRLQKLTIYNNPLLSLPEQLMGHMPDIKEFFLYATNLTTVPENLFANMSGLSTLHFDLNEWLSELPSELFCCLPNLHMLSMISNSLFYLHPQLFSRLTTLRTVFLNDNKLKNLPENIFQGLGTLQRLDLKNNHLKTLPGDIFLSNTNLRSVGLSGNPWNCTCSIRGIAKWIRHNERVIFDRDDVLCQSPVSHLQRTVGSLPDEEFDFCNVAQVKSYFPTQNDLQETRTSSPTIPTSERASAGATTQPINPTSTQGATQQETTPGINPTMKPSVLDATIQATSVQTPTTCSTDEEFLLTTKTPSAYDVSPFYNKLVVEQGPDFVHHTIHKGWAYVWFLPSNAVMVGFLMFCHIFLVATGLLLILATMYGMYCLSKIMDRLNAEFAHPPRHRKPR